MSSSKDEMRQVKATPSKTVRIGNPRIARLGSRRGLAFVLACSALQCNTFDDPPERGGDAPFAPTPDFDESPPVVSSLPIVEPLPPTPPVVSVLPVPPTATTLPDAIDGGLSPIVSTEVDTAAASSASAETSEPSPAPSVGEPTSIGASTRETTDGTFEVDTSATDGTATTDGAATIASDAAIDDATESDAGAPADVTSSDEHAAPTLDGGG